MMRVTLYAALAALWLALAALSAFAAPPDGLAECAEAVREAVGLPEADRRSYLEALGDTMDVPCIDPLVDGCDSIVRLMLKQV